MNTCCQFAFNDVLALLVAGMSPSLFKAKFYHVFEVFEVFVASLLAFVIFTLRMGGFAIMTFQVTCFEPWSHLLHVYLSCFQPCSRMLGNCSVSDCSGSDRLDTFYRFGFCSVDAESAAVR